MAVDFDSFVNWAEDRFNGEIRIKGNEVKLNSIFTEDHKFHMWCNVYGGKYQREDGVYHCWYTDRKGTLVGLVMLVDGCTYEEAKELLSGQMPIGELEKKLDEFFANYDYEIEFEKLETKLKIPEHTYWISSLNGIYRMEAESYLTKRKLPIDDLMYCVDGQYKNRIILPYYDKAGKLIYFNTRDIREKSKLRYLGPPKEVGVGKGDVIYCPKWPKPDSKIYLTEGEFDALTLRLLGLNAAACGGKVLSDKQIQMIRGYDICLAVDSDEAGLDGLIKMGVKLLHSQIDKITYVRPPMGIKDWNRMLTWLGVDVTREWVEKHEKIFDEWTEDVLMCQRL